MKYLVDKSLRVKVVVSADTEKEAQQKAIIKFTEATLLLRGAGFNVRPDIYSSAEELPEEVEVELPPEPKVEDKPLEPDDIPF